MEPEQERGSVLIVDDKRDVLTAIRLLLKDHVDTIHTTRNPATIPDLMREADYDVILLDMNFSQDASSGREGFQWLRRIRAQDPDMVVVMITAYGDIDKAVHAMKNGATDFITKPWENDRLVASVTDAIHVRRSRVDARKRAGAYVEEVDSAKGFEGILGESRPMQEVYATIRKVAPTDANVLILGENGTGKEMVGQAVHNRSRRKNQPFVMADLAALSESLFESELFGYVKGAFTGADAPREGRFEKADGGTLFLDEIGNVPRSLQSKLLTTLQRREVIPVGSNRSRSVDIRLVSATNQPVYEMVQRGEFRQDLLYRLNTVEIHLPPLRDRGEDISLMAHFFCRQFARRYDRAIESISDEAMERLYGYQWPGNVRELKHTMERAVILSEGTSIQPYDLSFSAPPAETVPDEDAFMLDSLDLESIEQAAVRKALSKNGGNISRAAQELGISRKALYRRIEKYGL